MQATSADNLNEELESGPEKVKIRLQAPGKPEMVATLVVNQPLKAAVDFYAQQHLSHAEQLLGIQHVKFDFVLHTLGVTPADLRLSDNDLVQLVLPAPAALLPGAPLVAPVAPALAPPAEPQVRLDLQDRVGNRETFRIRITAPFSKLIAAFAKSFNLDPKQISHLEFDGEKLDPNETPADHEMEDEWVIDVMMKKK